ncbi:MAG: 2-C-methyl-D-erythritol 2,4-cyclodiphosphate synthase [Clostridia bacterium]|nr:2-C-methyl-D-erythritol 2,4-cyclodiphosphate synthase [Clostridia bacterium]
MARCTAVIVAAGSSTRMGVPKLSIPLCGVTVLERTLTAFDASSVESLVVVTREEDIPVFSAWSAKLSKPCRFVQGGATRQQSVQNGLAAVDKDVDLIAVADGARPLITPEEIDRVIAVAAETKAAAAAVRVKDTIKQADENGVIIATPDRSSLWQVQTPQVFDAALYRQAMEAAQREGLDLTDDCQLVEHLGAKVTLVPTSYENLKITTPDDVTAAEAILKKRGGIGMRIGHGYDVHRLVEDRKLILGGVEVPFEKGLLGHSDADVLTHAIMDALLGAAAMGDIGGLFPDTDPAYKGADSIALLREVVARISAVGYTIENMDATVLAQRPKLKPFIESMRATVAAACGVAVERVNIKATTEEGLGFTGAMEGIAAHAVCLLG